MTLVDLDFLLCILHSLTHVVLLRLAGCNAWEHFVVHVQWCRRSAAVGAEADYLA